MVSIPSGPTARVGLTYEEGYLGIHGAAEINTQHNRLILGSLPDGGRVV